MSRHLAVVRSPPPAMLPGLLALLLLPSALGNRGRPGGDASCFPSPDPGSPAGPARPVSLQQAGFPGWRDTALQLSLSPAATTRHNLTARALGQVCEALGEAAAGGWCPAALQSVAGGTRVLGLGITNGTEVCGGLRQLVVTVEQGQVRAASPHGAPLRPGRPRRTGATAFTSAGPPSPFPSSGAAPGNTATRVERSNCRDQVSTWPGVQLLLGPRWELAGLGGDWRNAIAPTDWVQVSHHQSWPPANPGVCRPPARRGIPPRPATRHGALKA
jgi:hypothetical protein